MKIIFNQAKVKHSRRLLRRNMPLAEKLIWEKLRNRQLSGYKFKRQYSVNNFVVDFFCPETNLAIELDGESHFDKTDSQDKDVDRQKKIKLFGIKFIRFTNNEVYHNLDGVLQIINKNLTQPLLSKERS